MGTLADRIRQARRAAGASQTQLADRLELARSAIAHWEREEGTMPSALNLQGFATATGASIDWLLTGRGHMYFQSSIPLQGDDAGTEKTMRDPSEEQLLVAFRSLRPSARSTLLRLAGQLAPHMSRAGKNRAAGGSRPAGSRSAGSPRTPSD